MFGLIIVLVATYFLVRWLYKSGVMKEVEQMQRLRLQKQNALYEPQASVAVEEKLKLKRKPFPTKAEDAKRVHGRVWKQAGLFFAAVGGFLAMVGFIGQSWIPVALLAPPMVIAGVFLLRREEGKMREEDLQVQDFRQANPEQLYIPSDWLKDF